MSEVSSQTLYIVAREVASELNSARAALEAFGEQQENAELLRNCAARMHSVHGALRVAGVHGAGLLAEEMVHLLHYLADNLDAQRHLAEGLDALMRAMVQLPTYLERVLSGGRDIALVLLPLLNDLRAVRGHALLSEGTLLLLNLTSDRQPTPPKAASGDGLLTVAQWARKLRTGFQLALLGWIKGEREEDNLATLSRAAEKLENAATSQPVFQFWWVVGAALEGLREGGLEGGASIKRLLGQVDREMKRLYEQGEQRYVKEAPTDLLNNLLYYVARTTTSGQRVSAVRASFRLSELVPVAQQIEEARESLSAPSIKLMKTVAGAIKEDLSRVKDAIDIFVRKGGTDAEELPAQLETLRKIADTLGVLGLGHLREQVRVETQGLEESLAQGRVPNENILLHVAATLIRIEDSLDEQLVNLITPTGAAAPARGEPADDPEFRQVAAAVLRECIVNMARVKEAIALSIEKPQESHALEQVPALMRGIIAGLLMLGKTRAMQITEEISQKLAAVGAKGRIALAREPLERLADAMVAIEYYMETIQAGRSDPWYMLDNAVTCLSVLTDGAGTIPAVGDTEPVVEPARTVVMETMARTVATAFQSDKTVALSPAAKVAAAQVKSPWPVPVPPPRATTPTADDVPALDHNADPEFLHLFIEEARDELARLNEAFPAWDANPLDTNALGLVRRSFHTLKGSGRMVGAKLIGEFSWAIENLLNRLINRTLDRTPEIMALMRNALPAVEGLIVQLETGNAPALDVGKLIEEANKLGAKQAGPVAATPARNAAPAKQSPTPAAAAASMGATTVVAPAQGKKAAKAPSANASPAKASPAKAPHGMDPVLSEIFSKEASGHLATIRVYIAKCERMAPPYPVTDELHRSCHTLSGTGKTAGVAMSTRVAEPLNHYIRKLFDNSIGLPLPGLQALREAVGAIEYVIAHINEDATYFSSHAVIIARLAELDQALDQEITQITKLAHSTSEEAAATQEAPVAFDTEHEISFDSQTLKLQVPKLERNAQPETFDSTDLIEVGLMTATELDLLERRFFGRSTPDLRGNAKAETTQTPTRVEETARSSWDAVADSKAARGAGSMQVNSSVSASSRARFEPPSAAAPAPVKAPTKTGDSSRRSRDEREATEESSEDLFSNTDLDLLLSSKAPASPAPAESVAPAEEARAESQAEPQIESMDSEAEAAESVAEEVLLQSTGRVDREPIPVPLPMPALAVAGGAAVADGRVGERTWASERDDEPRVVVPPSAHTGATSEWEEIFAISTVVTQTSTFHPGAPRREPPKDSAEKEAAQAPVTEKPSAGAPVAPPVPSKPLEPDWVVALDAFAGFPEEAERAPAKPVSEPEAPVRNTSETALFAADIEGALERLARDELRARNQRAREPLGRPTSPPPPDPLAPAASSADAPDAGVILVEEEPIAEQAAEERAGDAHEEVVLEEVASDTLTGGMVVEETSADDDWAAEVSGGENDSELLLDDVTELADVPELADAPMHTGTDVRLPALIDGTHKRLPMLDLADEQVDEQPDEQIEIVAEPEHDTVHDMAADADGHADDAADDHADDHGADDEADADDSFDSEIAAIFTEEATELLDLAHSSLTHWSADRTNQAVALELKRALHTIKGGARMAGIRAMGDLSHELESCMQAVEVGTIPASQGVFDVLEAALDELHHMRDTVCNGERCTPARDLLRRIRRLSAGDSAPAVAPAAAAPKVVAPVAPAPVRAAAAAQPASPPAKAAVTQPVAQPVVKPIAQPAVQPVPKAAANVAAPAVTQTQPVTQARDVPAARPPVAKATVEKLAAPKSVPIPTAPVVAAAPQRAAAPASVARQAAPAPEPEIEIEIDVNAADAPLDTSPRAAVGASRSGQAEEPAPVVLPGREASVQDRQEFARVDADLLDKLLNGAGEVSIFRSRLEQQVSSIDFNLVELGRTVTRLKDQLRKFELEAEAQILHMSPEAARKDGFDPLEMDRYSSIQQLSRALAESVSDVGSIEGLLGNLTREAQNLLLQQSRVVTELQNGLMRTRMVPFQRHVQRLSRIVRQVATETGKRAELVVDGGSGELDRQVLERMLPPFEHMLRNSVVHGIETPEERVAAGKPEKGTITLTLRREGAEVVVEIADDGRGIDVKAVRERARARGLLQSGHELSDEEALQLVLEPGFSTASSVTQHAGRGVGMDVVVTEIKRLGGGLFTESTPGKGVKFTIRLPFTLAITQALLARIGEELYALPLATVEGVARLPRSQVQKHLTEETSTFNYGGQVYRFQHLGAFVGAGPSVLPEADVPVSVILIRAGEHSAALVSDELIGNREMVVKSVGPQISSIRGIAGATILGDGRVVIILDVGALVRSEWRFQVAAPMQAPVEDRRVCALVVDDSITVRRVTQRLLERHGMKVMTAKDGVDAIAVLEEQLPDVILLDIEMPRMDGYELATHVRNDARLAHIPIVMITSRVGDKHRSRAMEIGVNDYLGKPYQEHQLLDAIEPLVAAPKRRRPR